MCNPFRYISNQYDTNQKYYITLLASICNPHYCSIYLLKFLFITIFFLYLGASCQKFQKLLFFLFVSKYELYKISTRISMASSVSTTILQVQPIGFRVDKQFLTLFLPGFKIKCVYVFPDYRRSPHYHIPTVDIFKQNEQKQKKSVELQNQRIDDNAMCGRIFTVSFP